MENIEKINGKAWKTRHFHLFPSHSGALRGCGLLQQGLDLLHLPPQPLFLTS